MHTVNRKCGDTAARGADSGHFAVRLGSVLVGFALLASIMASAGTAGATCSCDSTPSFETSILTALRGEATAWAVTTVSVRPPVLKKVSKAFGKVRAGLHKALLLSLVGKLEQANGQLAKQLRTLEKLDEILTSAATAGVVSTSLASEFQGLRTLLVGGIGDLKFQNNATACSSAGPVCGVGACPAGTSCILDTDLGLGCVCYGFGALPPVP